MSRNSLFSLLLLLGLTLTACGTNDPDTDGPGDGGDTGGATELNSQSYTAGPQAYLEIAEDAEVTFQELADGTTEVTIDLGEIDSAFASHPAHIHMGDAGSGGDIVVTLEPVDGATGASTSTVTAFDGEDGARNAGDAVTYEELTSYDGYVNVHLSEDNLDVVFASANIGENADVALPDVPSIADLVTSSANAEAVIDQEFTVLLQALSVADSADVAALTAQLADDAAGPFTVLAPTDAAFEAFIADNSEIEDAAALLASDALANILSYHVLSGAVVRTEVVAAASAEGGTALETLQGGSLTVSADDGGNILIGDTLAITVDDDVASRTNLTASNGVVHVLETVLTPPAPAADQ